MSKRVLKWFSILFLSSILVLSCSNANKTGSGDNNSGNGGSGTGGDGGTTPTPQPDGIAKYAGTWTAKFNNDNSYDVIIDSNGNVTIKDPSGKQIKAENIEGSGNKYTMKVQHSSGIEASTVTITFTDEKSGTITDTSDAFGAGSDGDIRKQNNGSKGLWYYEGTWNFQETNPGTGKGTIGIGKDGSVNFTMNEQLYTTKEVTDKVNETYEAKFIGESDAETLVLTLKFNDDSTGSYEVKITDTQKTTTGTLTKQKQ